MLTKVMIVAAVFLALFCASMPCMSGATCSEEAAGFSCTCAEDFTGNTCDTGQWNSCI